MCSSHQPSNGADSSQEDGPIDLVIPLNEPTTEAGRAMLAHYPVTVDAAREAILAIEREAQAIPLIDVDLLRESIVKAAAFADGPLNLTDLAAAEYARLASDPNSY